MVSGDGVAEWFKALDLKCGSPWSMPLLPGFVLGNLVISTKLKM